MCSSYRDVGTSGGLAGLDLSLLEVLQCHLHSDRNYRVGAELNDFASFEGPQNYSHVRAPYVPPQYYCVHFQDNVGLVLQASHRTLDGLQVVSHQALGIRPQYH